MAKKKLSKVDLADLRDYYGKLQRRLLRRIQRALKPTYSIERAIAALRQANELADKALAIVERTAHDQERIEQLKAKAVEITILLSKLDSCESHAEVKATRKLIRRTLRTKFFKGTDK
jgi:hypothetical protein